jgi:hypothetical protein
MVAAKNVNSIETGRIISITLHKGSGDDPLRPVPSPLLLAEADRVPVVCPNW